MTAVPLDVALTLIPIGRIRVDDDAPRIEVASRFREGLRGLDGFSHVQVLWWFDRDSTRAEAPLEVIEPYPGVESIGVFATRSPERPDPIALSTCGIVDVDPARGRVTVHHIDSWDGSYVLDLKPYTPSLDRVQTPTVPPWCAGWPLSLEASAHFDWSRVFAGE